MLEARQLLTVGTDGLAGGTWHNLWNPTDVNADGAVSPHDALIVVNRLGQESMRGDALPAAPMSHQEFVDVNADDRLSPVDALLVINDLGRAPQQPAGILADALDVASRAASLNAAEELGPQNLLTSADVDTLLQRASMVSPSTDAIIAVVDRTGRILGVRVEAGVNSMLQSDSERLAFAIDGAVAKARTAAFFSNNEAPLTSRTIRFISQSTITQREVESAPNDPEPTRQGPGFVGPIGVGGHFPPEVRFTPQVDLFAIEHQSRDSQWLDIGPDGVFGTADDLRLTKRFNVDDATIAIGAEAYFETWPESYGRQTGFAPNALGRGIATLPGGIPLYKIVRDAEGVIQQRPGKNPPLPDINLVGGIGVFVPGPDGFASFEQNFVHASLRNGVAQTEYERMNSDKALESEFIALVAASGAGQMVGPSALTRNLSEFTRPLPALPDFVLPTGRIDLVGITLEIYGPTPNRQFRIPGIDRLIDFGRRLNGPGANSQSPIMIPLSRSFSDGQPVPEGWLIVPHDAADGSLTAEQVEQIIVQAVTEAKQVRAAIRLEIDNQFKPGARTRMVLAVADRSGNVLGLFRMPDATNFSVDVAVAKARNTAYYADAEDLQEPDRVDFNGDGVLGPVSQNLQVYGDTVPPGTAFTNRTFRFLAEPRYPTGIDVDPAIVNGLNNDATQTLCDQQPVLCQQIAPFSILRMPGINPITAENLSAAMPLPASVYNDPIASTVLSFTAFNASRNFRDPGDDDVVISGTDIHYPLANQNGVVYFPGSAPLYVNGLLVGGFGVSGDGVDQDDVVTTAGVVGFDVPSALRVDQFIAGFVRLPFAKFNRNPLGR